jgi:homoserine kinase
LRKALEAHLRRAVLLSGSGPTLVALYPSPDAAAEAAASLEAAETADLGTATVIVTSTSRGGKV